MSGKTGQTCPLYRMAPDDYVAGDRAGPPPGGWTAWQPGAALGSLVPWRCSEPERI